MARPKKKAEIEKELSPLEKRRLQRQEELKRKAELKQKITRDLEITVMCLLSNSEFMYDCPATRAKYNFTEYGQTDYMTYDIINNMKNKKKGILENYYIIPIAVDESSGVTLEEVIESLGLSNLYIEEMFDEGFLDEMLIDFTTKELKDTFKEVNKKYAIRIADRALKLYEEDQLTDSTKFRVIRNAVDMPTLFDGREDDE